MDVSCNDKMPCAARPLAGDATEWTPEQWGVARAYTLSTLDDLCAGDHRKRARLARFGAFGLLAAKVASGTARQPPARQGPARRPSAGAAGPTIAAAPGAALAAPTSAAAAPAPACQSGGAVHVQEPQQPQTPPRRRGRRGGARRRPGTSGADAAAADAATAAPATVPAALEPSGASLASTMATTRAANLDAAPPTCASRVQNSPTLPPAAPLVAVAAAGAAPTTASDAEATSTAAAAVPAADSDVEMAVAAALAEVLAFPDVTFDEAAAVEAMDVGAQQLLLPAPPSDSSPMEDEHAPNMSALERHHPVGARADRLPTAPSRREVRNDARALFAVAARAASTPGPGSTKKQAKAARSRIAGWQT